MVGALVGIDVGATKTHVRVERINGEVLHDNVFATPLWRAQPYANKAKLIASWIHEALPKDRVAAFVLGAQGCDNEADSEKLRQCLGPLLDAPTLVVNDAQLLAAAAERPGSIELTAGTGSIAVGHTSDGKSAFTGGWGWLLGDEGGAAGLVRDAVRRLARSKDEQCDPDLLEQKLLEVSGAADLKDLNTMMMQGGGSAFTTWAPVLFDAADEGSAIAVAVIESGAKELHRLVELLIAKGIRAKAVVAAGSVIVNQRRLAESLRTSLAQSAGLELVVLHTPPVHGAIRLAGALYNAHLNDQHLHHKALINSSASNPGNDKLSNTAATPRKE